MKSLDLTKEALRDLGRITRWSTRQWGIEQAVRYRSAIILRLSRLMTSTRGGSKWDALRTGLRRVNVQSHAIYFVVEGEIVTILRVMHKSQDVTKAFGGDKR